MFDYLLKSGVCLLVFYVFYALFLEKENMHVYKRIYLLGFVIVSFIIPKITYTTYIEVAPQLVSEVFRNVLPIQPVHEVAEQQNLFPILLGIIYLLGLVVFGFRFLKNFFDVNKKINNNQKIQKRNSTSVLLIEDIVPHTFLSFIFYNKQKYLTKDIPEEVIVHEETHAKQKHTLDVLFIEILKVVFWFNPIFYFIEKSIKLNHEFLADQAVINKGINPQKYQNTLLAYSSHTSQFQLANAINYSSIKKRLVIMKTQTSKNAIWLRSSILIALVALLLFSFSNKEILYQEKASKEMVAEYNKLATKYNNKQINNYHYKEVERLKYIYKLMTSFQKESAQPFPDFPAPPPLPPVTPPKYPKNGLYFVNDKEVSLKDVKKLSHKDVQSYFVHKEDQFGNKLEVPTVHLFTNDYRGVVAPKKISPAQLKEYNTLAKHYNKQSKQDMLVKLKDVNRLTYLYRLMNSVQKKAAEKFPEFPPMPPSPKKVIKGVNDTDAGNPPPPPLPPLSPLPPLPNFPSDAAYILNNKSVPYKDILELDKASIQRVDIVVDRDSEENKSSKQIYYIVVAN